MSANLAGVDSSRPSIKVHGPHDGPLVVLVHGTPDTSGAFAAVLGHLADMRVITYDRRGYGRSVHMPPPLTMRHHALDLLGIAERCPRPPVVVANSFGSNPTMLAAITFRMSFAQYFGVIGKVANAGRLPLGYLNDPEKSAATFVEVDGERYCFTGDMATVEADGTIQLLGRGSLCINTGGEKVFPREVEELIYTHPAIAEAALIPQPDAKLGEIPVAVVALKPDLVLAHGKVNWQAVAKLEKLGLTVFAIDPKTLGEVARDIRTIGKITARPKTADKVAARIEDAVRSVRASRANKPSRKVLVVISSNPLWAAGPKTIVDEMLTIAHAKNVASSARPGFVPFSKEAAIARNPDVIITGIKADVSFFTKSPEWRTTNAVKNKRVYALNSDLLFRTGPRLAEGLRELARKMD